MPRPKYRNAGFTAEVGDLVRGWSDAAATEEVSGVVVSVHPDHLQGDNLTLAVLDLDEQPDGVEIEPEECAPGEVLFKNHDGRSCLLSVRTIAAHSDRMELHQRRTKLARHRGMLREPSAETKEARERDQESRRRQMEAGSFVPPKAGAEPNPIVSTPPDPLPERDEDGRPVSP